MPKNSAVAKKIPASKSHFRVLNILFELVVYYAQRFKLKTLLTKLFDQILLCIPVKMAYSERALCMKSWHFSPEIENSQVFLFSCFTFSFPPGKLQVAE